MLYYKKINTLKHFAGLFRLRLYCGYWLAAVALFFSCNKPPKPVDSGIAYKKVLDSANRMYDAGKYLPAMHYLDSASSRFKNLALPQKFEYYSFHCNYFFHLKKDNKQSMLYADSMLALFDTPEKKLQYISHYGVSYFSKGDVLFAENKYNEA